MKYLKLFEYYNEYYQEVDSGYFYDFIHSSDEFIHRPTIDLDTTEINKIKNLFSGANISLKVDDNNFQNGNVEGNVDGTYQYEVKFLDIHIKDVFIHVYKMGDEWYMVYWCDVGKYQCDDMDNYNEWYESHEKYYKCDQYQGLIKCLTDLSKKV